MNSTITTYHDLLNILNLYKINDFNINIINENFKIIINILKPKWYQLFRKKQIKKCIDYIKNNSGVHIYFEFYFFKFKKLNNW
jgi:hypothetical protein